MTGGAHALRYTVSPDAWRSVPGGSWAAATQTCDRHACPAPAQRTLLIHGQDFHFCGHRNFNNLPYCE